MRDLPSGTVTLLFTDIEGSTKLLHELGDRYADVLAEHRRVLRDTFQRHGGVEVDTQGDAFFYAFSNARDAVEAADKAQLALADGRELLRIRGEVRYEVPPLAETEAVELFCDRARVEPSGEVEELCTRLDNLPLAVELAAARVRVLSPAQILERVSQRLDLLKGGRDADTRQRTLRATIEWSYELLSEAEQQLFRRLSVFAGGCTLHAAEEVAEAELDTLQSLVDKSLLRHAEERYWMLETIREYAAERLSESGEAEEMGQRHAAWILGLAAKGDEPLEPEAQDRWLDRLAIELSNLRVALSWAASRAFRPRSWRCAGV